MQTSENHSELGPIPPGAEALVLAQLLETAPAILHICVNDRSMDALAAALPFFAPDAEIIRLPAWDCLPYDRVSPRPAILAERAEALSLLAGAPSKGKRIILTTISSILQKAPPRALMARSRLDLSSAKRDTLLAFLDANGYRRAGKAIEPGEFAVRGGIIDLIPPGMEGGLRLDFFGDELESARGFDPMTQLSTGSLNSLPPSGGRVGEGVLSPVSEVMLHEASIARFRAAYRERFGAVNKDDPLYEAVSAGQTYPGMEHWLPLFHDSLDTLADYAPDALLTFESQAREAIAERQETIRDYYDARQSTLKAKTGVPYNPLPPEALYLMPDAWETALEERKSVWFSPFSSLRGEAEAIRQNTHSGSLRSARNDGFNLKPAPNLAALRSGAENPFDQLREYAGGKSVLLAALSAGSAERLQGLMAEHGLHVLRIATFSDAKNISGKTVGLCVLPLAHGFETASLAIVTEQDLLGERIIRAKARKKAPEAFLAEAANFMEGELVVHREHGIGRYAGLVTLEAGGARHDCLKLVYEGDDRLFLPVENIDLISRYGSDEEGAKLDKLGAASWQARKARLKERIQIAAEALLKTAAERQLKEAPALTPAQAAYEAFCARFPYMETDDQQRSIDETLEELHSGKPMDRLICGDVGFGKTEVALRAAFACVTPRQAEGASGEQTPAQGGGLHQVALIVPTTLLARQHYKNFRERFDGFGIRVAQLSRMVPASEQKKVREGVKDGSVDIVIGTHALLAKGVEFKRLGLVIVDEEQHFGVAQKEKLKELKSDVHVLTLSATPIPRTMQMALSGVRSLSLIATPPVDRLAVRSFVMPWDAVVLREAILREKHRGGRVFFVTPRVRDIGDLKVKLAELTPEIRVGVAHGQLTPMQLDEIMNDFYDGKYDLLLSTAIVESGLDIPQANTIIIHRADRFGLSQLYQMRGRVGRGKLRAYAYFLLPPHRELTKAATRRLEVMQSLDSLGAGFQVASHDMDIRGFGNLVGEEQSGHIREVGVELYQQMLEEAVAALRKATPLPFTGEGVALASDLAVAKTGMGAAGEGFDKDFSPQINLGLSVLIPEEYVSDLSLRLGLYRRAGNLNTPEEIDAFAAELIDRFGTLPEETAHLLEIVRIRQLCRKAGIARIDAGPKGAVLSFHNDSIANPAALLAYIAKHPTRLKLRPDQKLVYMKEWESEVEKVKGVMKLAGEMAAL